MEVIRKVYELICNIFFIIMIFGFYAVGCVFALIIDTANRKDPCDDDSALSKFIGIIPESN